MRLVKRLLNLQIRTPAFDRSVDYYSTGFGLDVRVSADGATAQFIAVASDKPVLTISRAPRAEVVGLSFAVASVQELRDATAHLRANGHPPLETATPSDAALSILDPDGRRVTLQVDQTVIGAEDAGGQPLMLSHVVLNSPDVHRLTAFFVDVLGFTIADRYEQDFLTFLRCDQPQHHCIGVSPGQVAGLNHFSIDVGSVDGVMKGVGRMQKLGFQPIWGPGRHGPGGNVFCYFEDPSGFVAEFTCDVLQIEDEANWVAKEWPRTPDIGNVWGTGSPSPRAIELMSGQISNGCWVNCPASTRSGWKVLELHNSKGSEETMAMVMCGIGARISACLGAIVIAGAVATSTVSAQDWPQRAVKVLIPFGPGSSTDIAARIVTDKLQAAWGKPVVVEPRPGGDAFVAINAFVSADDHTLLLAPSSAFVTHPYRYAKVSYDRARDLIPVAQMSAAIAGLAVPAVSGMTSLKDFIDHARANPGKLNVAAAPSASEMMVDVFLKEQGLDVSKVPYRDIVQGVTDLTTNRIQGMFAAVTIFQAGIEAKTLRVISVTGKSRTPVAPGVLTAEEQGHPRLGIEGTIGVFAHRTMTQEARARLATDFLKVVTEPEVTGRLTSIGQVSAPGDSAAFAASIARQQAAFEEINKIVPVPLK